jgi:hypothetical protein
MVLPALLWKSIHHEGHEEHEEKKKSLAIKSIKLTRVRRQETFNRNGFKFRIRRGNLFWLPFPPHAFTMIPMTLTIINIRNLRVLRALRGEQKQSEYARLSTRKPEELFIKGDQGGF